VARKREKGKISRDEWPVIVARYERGETIAQIGREYNCTAPAIRYIIRRTAELSADPGPKPASGSLAAPTQRKSNSSELRPETRLSDRPAFGHLSTPQQALRARRTVGAALSLDVRERVSGDIAAFLVALDQADASSAESLNVLRDATDSLMRSAARIRIELERLFSASSGGEEEKFRRKPPPAGVAGA
jgi:transposase-like protein